MQTQVAVFIGVDQLAEQQKWSKWFTCFQNEDQPQTAYLYYSNVKAIQKINEAELKLGLDSKKSWHDMYSDSAYVFIGMCMSIPS